MSVMSDISSNRKMLKMLLSGTGAVIDLAENGQEAVTKVLDTISGGYDIVFMDNLMPVMVGGFPLHMYSSVVVPFVCVCRTDWRRRSCCAKAATRTWW